MLYDIKNIVDKKTTPQTTNKRAAQKKVSSQGGR